MHDKWWRDAPEYCVGEYGNDGIIMKTIMAKWNNEKTIIMKSNDVIIIISDGNNNDMKWK